MRVDVTVEIEAPLEDVFAYIIDFEKNPSWQQGMVSCTFTTPPPLAVGSQYQQVAQFMGRDVVSVFEVKKLIPNERVEFETIESTFPIQIVREVKEQGGSTVVHAIINGQPGGIIKLLSPFAKIMMRRSIEADYQRLKHLLESKQ